MSLEFRMNLIFVATIKTSKVRTRFCHFFKILGGKEPSKIP